MTDWTTCRVVQDRDGDLWGSAIAKGERWWANLGYFVSHTTDELEHHFGPITPVLDADGQPVVRTVGDLTARHIGRRVRVGTEGAEGSLDALDIGRHRFVVYLIGADAVHVLGGLTLDTPCEVLDA